MFWRLSSTQLRKLSGRAGKDSPRRCTSSRDKLFHVSRKHELVVDSQSFPEPRELEAGAGELSRRQGVSTDDYLRYNDPSQEYLQVDPQEMEAAAKGYEQLGEEIRGAKLADPSGFGRSDSFASKVVGYFRAEGESEATSVEGLAEGVRYVTNMVVQQDGESGQAFNLDQYGEFLEKMEGKK